MRAVIAIIVLIGSPAWADLDQPTKQSAGAAKCKLGPVVTLATVPNQPAGARVKIAVTKHRGMVIYDSGDTYWSQRFTTDGAVAGKRAAWKWGDDASTDGVDALVALGDGFLALRASRCGHDRCVSARWTDASGVAGATASSPLGARDVSINVWTIGDEVHALAQRAASSTAKTDLWLVFKRTGDRDVQVTSHEVDLGVGARLDFQPDDDGAWMFGLTFTPKLEPRFANSDGTSGLVTGWDPKAQFVALGRGRELLAWSDDHHTEWIEYHLALDGKLTEVRRIKRAAALPAPFVDILLMDPDTVGGVTAHREDRLGVRKSDTLLSSHDGGYPVADVWANGRFYIAYAEDTAARTALKLRTMTCR